MERKLAARGLLNKVGRLGGPLSGDFLWASAKSRELGWAARIRSQTPRVCCTVREEGLPNAPAREKLEHFTQTRIGSRFRTIR